ADVSVDFNDIFDDLQLGFAGIFSARWGRLGLYSNFQYAETGSQVTVAGPTVSSAHLENQQALFGTAVTYRVYNGDATFDVLGGARYNWSDSDLDVNFTNGSVRSAGNNADWIDAFVGMMGTVPLGADWTLFGYADIGAGESDYTYQAYLGLDWA